MWPSGPEAPKDPPHARSPNRRHGPAVALADRVPPDCASEPRQSAVNAPPASTRRVDARLGPVRPWIGPQIGLRAAIDPTAYAESAAQRAPVARSVRLRPVRAALSPLSAAHQRSVG